MHNSLLRCEGLGLHKNKATQVLHTKTIPFFCKGLATLFLAAATGHRLRLFRSLAKEKNFSFGRTSQLF